MWWYTSPTVRYHDNCCNNYLGVTSANARRTEVVAPQRLQQQAIELRASRRPTGSSTAARWSSWMSGVIGFEHPATLAAWPAPARLAIVGVRESFGQAGTLEPIDEPGGVRAAVQAGRRRRRRSAGPARGRRREAEHEQRHVLGVGEVGRAADRLQLVEAAVGQQQHVEVHVAAAGDGHAVLAAWRARAPRCHSRRIRQRASRLPADTKAVATDFVIPSAILG